MNTFIAALSPYMLANAVAFYVLPFFGKETGHFILLLLVLYPVISFGTAFILGLKKGFNPLFPLTTLLLFIPSIYVFYNNSAWLYPLIYAILSFTGNTAGYFLRMHKDIKGKNRDERSR
ncbi:MAG: hypothetical protein PUB21_10285 [Bacteroidales bacterium]|nr:hypothetical protein [Bacteroidales bacterium]